MRISRYLALGAVGPVALVSWLFLTVGASALTGPDSLILASAREGGVKGNSDSSAAALSADGSKVVFSSFATNLDRVDKDGFADIYVKELRTGNLHVASSSDEGVKGNGSSVNPAISPDGTKVAFESTATNLDPADTGSGSDIYVKDLLTGDIILASTSDEGVAGNGYSSGPTLSWDGERVAFYTSATNLDPADTDSLLDVYVKDLMTGDITLASISGQGVKGDSNSTWPSLSSDGTRVGFQSASTNLEMKDTTNLWDIFVKDLVGGDLILASTSDLGVKGNGHSWYPVISANGRAVAFQSLAFNLDPIDTDAFNDIYWKDLASGEIVLVSTSNEGVKGISDSFLPSLSADGMAVAFHSLASNLHPGDGDAIQDVYVKDVLTGSIILLSTSDQAVKGDADSVSAALSADGGAVAFTSEATNLDPADPDSLEDVYAKKLPAM